MRRELLNYQKKHDDSDEQENLLITKAIEKEILVLEKIISRHEKANRRKYDFKKHMDQSITIINALFESNANKNTEHTDLKPVINHRCMKRFVDKVLGNKTTNESKKKTLDMPAMFARTFHVEMCYLPNRSTNTHTWNGPKCWTHVAHM